MYTNRHTYSESSVEVIRDTREGKVHKLFSAESKMEEVESWMHPKRIKFYKRRGKMTKREFLRNGVMLKNLILKKAVKREIKENMLLCSD